MGCGASTTKTAPTATPVVTGPSEQNEPLLTSERPILAKLDHGITLTYAYMSQKGYYPESLAKPNQDTFIVKTEFGSDPNRHFFGVFDGHGGTGHDCAQFARDKVTEKLQRLLQTNSVTDSFTISYREANDEMHRAAFDDSLSGTTAICVLFDHAVITTANAGDSRAIIGVMNAEGKLEAKPLSFDQTPFRKNWGQDKVDEVDDEGDPPRIWAPDGNYPGSAFTRSLGDAVAETLGVVADPELYVKQLTKSDKYIIIASDGVWEFLTNQAVLEVVDKSLDPLEACNAVIDQAYELWLRFDVRTDDITMICIRIDVDKESDLPVSDAPAAGEMKQLEQMLTKGGAAKPVRVGMSKEKKKAVIMGDASAAGDDKYNAKEHFVPKTPGEIASISDAVKNNFLFQHLKAEQRQDIFDVMFKKHVRPGDRVITQGEDGDKFYVVESGDFDVRVKVENPGETSREDTVHKYKGVLHPSFGELALMFGKPRAASVVAVTDGTLWVLDRLAFRSLLMHNPKQELTGALRKVKILKSLTSEEVSTLADLMKEQNYEDGQEIVKAGTVSDTLFLIKQGEVEVRSDTGIVISRLKPKEAFNVESLVDNPIVPLNSTMVASGPVRLYQIDRQSFESKFGALNTLVEQQQRRKRIAKRWKVAIRRFMTSRCWLLTPKVQSNDKLTFITEVGGTGYGFVGLYEAKLSDRRASQPQLVTVKVISKALAESTGQENAIKNDIKHHRQIRSPACQIPWLVGVQTQKDAVYSILKTNLVCSVESLVKESEAGFFDESKSKLLLASGVLGLEAIHSQPCIFRGISDSMMFIDADGQLQFLDYRFCKRLDFEGGRTYTLCGDPEFFAPELISGQGYGISVDWWALGVLYYYLLMGHTPFQQPGDEENELVLFRRICSHTGKLTFSEYVSADSRDLVEQLLVPDVAGRLGCRGNIDRTTGGNELRSHVLFKGLDWSKLASRSLQSDLKSFMTERFNGMKSMREEEPPLDQYQGAGTWLQDF